MSFGFSAQAVPIVSNVEPTSLSDSTFVITWSTTNEDSTTEILYGAGALTNVVTIAAQSSTKFHYVELTGLYQNTTYQYRVKSGSTTFPPSPLFSPLSFTTLPKPSGEYLFSFAVLNDLRYANGKTSTQSSRGIPYQYCSPILTNEVNEINGYVDPNGTSGVAFTVLNGNIIEGQDTSTTYGNQASTEVQVRLESLRAKPADLTPRMHKYLPVPGFHDKKASYTTDWITNSFKPLTISTTIESEYGYNAASKDADSVFNYQFKYKFYNFIFLDSVKAPADATGSVDLTKVYNLLSAESASKTFIFMSYPGYDPLASGTKDYPVDIPTSEVGGALAISNHAAFRSTLEAFKDTSGNKIVAAVISGHLGDNFNRTIEAISYIRQGPALQYPTGYSIYKVYSTGFVKSFYKVKARDANGKPYYELARDQISAETVSSQLLGKDALTQFWLGSSSNRNFTQQYAFIPGLPPNVIATGPASNEAAVTLNAPILITFNKRMSTSDLTSWVTIKDAGNNPLFVSSADFIDASRTILRVGHPDLSVDTTYTVTVNAANAKDEGSTAMSSTYSNYVFSFNTNGGTKDVAPPTSSVDPLPSNSTADPFPSFTGTATDSARVIVVEYRFDNTGAWTTAEAVQGKFSGVTEVFQIKPSNPLSAGSHQLWLRTYDGIGNTSAEGYMAYAFAVVIGDKPTTASLKINGSAVYAGDPIDSTPKIEITISSINSLGSGRISVDSTLTPLTFVKVDTNYYATHEVSAALSDGVHTIKIEAFDVNGNASTYEASSLYVQAAQDTIVQSTPLNYPNPFVPGAQSTTIGYMLSKDAAINLTIHDLAGSQLVKKSFASGDNGGKAGYNTVSWDGKTDGGDYVGNGIYVYLIIGDGKVLSKGKLTVIKR